MSKYSLPILEDLHSHLLTPGHSDPEQKALASELAFVQRVLKQDSLDELLRRELADLAENHVVFRFTGPDSKVCRCCRQPLGK